MGAVGQPGTENKLPFALCLPRRELVPSCGSRGSFPRRTGAARRWWTSRCAGSFSSPCLGFYSQWATRFPGASTDSSFWYIPFGWLPVHWGGIGVVFWARVGVAETSWVQTILAHLWVPKCLLTFSLFHLLPFGLPQLEIKGSKPCINILLYT